MIKHCLGGERHGGRPGGRASARVDESRRTVVSGLVGTLAAITVGRAGAQPDTARVELARLVVANRILAHEGVVDAFGHVSIRDPDRRDRYVMSRSRSPELVELDDLIRFEQDGRSLDPLERLPYGERMIHGAVYEARDDVGAVVHNHAYPLLPFGVTGRPLRPLIHVASVIGAEVPIWDIATSFGETDMLVRTMAQGRDLAAALGTHTCLLMRGHGAVVTGRSLEEAVVTAIYLKINAEVQLEAMALGEPRPLSAVEVERSRATQFSPLAIDRAWEYFSARAGVEAP
jgi:HCOMODA/2-hydroxy-3-carboxy-muconic semialdehyde decarboxylase